MNWITHYLWLIPALPLTAAAVSALLRQRHRRTAATLAIGAMALAFALSCIALSQTVGREGDAARHIHNFTWFTFGDTPVRLGWVLDPLTAAMLVMITFVGSLIFIFSVGYMAHDGNCTRFFCFLSLFAAAMLGLVISNSLLLLFMCWELVGLASYLLIGFWYHKPTAAAAARKAFVTTRIGDVFFLLGIVWLYGETGTLLFYDGGQGTMEASALGRLVAQTTAGGIAIATAISLLIFCGAIGKSGQVPLHVWLPDAMEGPTPVSALIHAATMVAAGVFLVARVYPLMAAQAAGAGSAVSPALQVVTWVGVVTAVFAALIAVAQTDIKRILAYSTVSQLGLMFVGLGVGGVAVGMFHLLTHAFFKALLFLGAGSVIHGCHEEQDIRKMGGLRKFMPVTFATYAVGMMALAGVPLVFSGFWSKDEILHAALSWEPSKLPFLLALLGALLTSFYMTRQMALVFFGAHRGGSAPVEDRSHDGEPGSAHHHAPHESPPVMTVPLILLAVCTVLLTLLGTPAWPAIQEFLRSRVAEFHPAHLVHGGTLLVIGLSTLVVGAGLGLGWWLYGRGGEARAARIDPLEALLPSVFGALRNKLFVDELYDLTIIRAHARLARLGQWLDDVVLGSLTTMLSYAVLGLAWVNRFLDEYGINGGFDRACDGLRGSGSVLSRLHDGPVQRSLRVIGVALAALLLVLLWGWAR